MTPARLDGVTSASVDRSVLDAMAVAGDRAEIHIGSWPREATAGATLALSGVSVRRRAQLVALANPAVLMIRRTISSPGKSDPRQKVYAIDQLLVTPPPSPTRQVAKPAATAAAIEMDYALADQGP